MTRRLARPWSQRAERYDVVVVGSGYGGGVTASRLARAGKSVAVLERGREFLTGEFPGRFPDLKNQLKISGARINTGPSTALFDVRLGKDMHVLLGCGLGGGSLINGGVALRPDARVFEDPVWPDQLTAHGLLDEGFRRAEKWIRPARHDQAPTLAKYKALKAAADHLGHTMVKCPIAVSFDATVNPAGIEQPGCTLCGDCCGGCNVGAKNTVALTYLPDAARHGADIFTEITVQHIEKLKDGSWRVHTKSIDSVKKVEIETTLDAATVVLAAGTLGSSEILLRSTTLGLQCSDMLGRRFSANGDIIAFGYGAKPKINCIGIGHPPKLDDLEVGAVVSGQIEIYDPDNLNNGMCIQEGALPSALAPALPVLFLPDGRLLGALKSLVNGVYKGPFAHLQTYFAVSHDTSGGWLTLEDNQVRLNWPNAKDEPVYAKLDKMLSEIVGHAGGDYVKNPLAGTVMGHQPATAHPLGGCCMGHDAGNGVVNHKSQVFDASNGRADASVHDGLYVIDGSIIARSLGVNPLLTISALAERAMIHFAQDHQLSFDDAAVEATPVAAATPGGVYT